MVTNRLSNDDHIAMVNGRNMSYTLAHNQFSGMDSEEFREHLGYSGHWILHSALRFHPETHQNKMEHAKCLLDCVKGQDECTADKLRYPVAKILTRLCLLIRLIG